MQVLVADDSVFCRSALEAMLRNWGYQPISVGDGLAAFELLRQDTAPKLAILDWTMPGLDGVEVCRRLRELDTPEPTYILMLTIRDGTQNIIAALRSGADDYLTKPFDREELHARLQVGRRIVSMQTSQIALHTFVRAAEAKSPYTQGHADRVTQYALALADRLGLSRNESEVVRRGALLHDIGKIAIPDAILDKPGPLTPAERAIIEQHPMNGVKMVESLQSLADVIPLIRWHHERLDGGGYPDGLRGDQIPFLVRLLSVADCYDAMSSDRPYRAALAPAVALEQLHADAAKGGLDVQLVEIFSSLMPLSANKRLEAVWN
jgi:putative two-component system response regulator